MFRYASNFRADPYGWLTNQVSHIGLGLFLVFVACWVWLKVFGEFPVRWHLWLVIVGAYLVWELFVQGWQGFDTIEDLVFVTIYGSGSALFVFREFRPGDGVFYGSVDELGPFLLVAAFHLVTGVGVRAFQSWKIPAHDK